MKTLLKNCLSICNRKRLPILNHLILLNKNNQMLESEGIFLTSVGCLKIIKDDIIYYLNSSGITYHDGQANHQYYNNNEVSHRLQGEYHGKINEQMMHGDISDMKEEDVFNRGYFWKSKKLN